MNEKDRRTRIAHLQDRQAELETEIQLLKQSHEFDKLITEEPANVNGLSSVSG